MKNKNKIMFAALILLTVISKAQSMEPGIWKTKASFKLNGLPLPSDEKENCITADQAKDAKSTITEGLKKDGCEITKWNLKKDKLEASLACKNKDVEAKGDFKGTFTRKGYSLEGDAKGKYLKSIPSVAHLSLTGEWVKSCQ